MMARAMAMQRRLDGGATADVQRTGLSEGPLQTVSVDLYESIERGESQVEEWGPRLAQIAIKLSTPTSRLISETGKAKDAALAVGQCGKLIRKHREKRSLSQQQLAEQLQWQVEQLESVENGESLLESLGPLLLRFAETIEQPIFNLFYPCGLPFGELKDYP